MKNYQLKIIIPVLYLAASMIMFSVLFRGEPSSLQISGMILTCIAFALWIISRVQLGDSFSIGAKANKLVTHGIYSKIRHPVYVFSVLACVGLVLATGIHYLWFVVFGLVILELVRIRAEEKVLTQKFGEEYEAYKRTTWF